MFLTLNDTRYKSWRKSRFQIDKEEEKVVVVRECGTKGSKDIGQ